MFQSLVGLKINWNIETVAVSELVPMFQSLVGLKINWNWNLAYKVKLFQLVFQSLVGLKINWNVKVIVGV